MPLFEQTIPIQRDEVAELVRQYWKLELGDIIKASQNHTFQAQHTELGTKFIVRVTPDPHQQHAQRVRDEIFFVRYLAQHTEDLHHVCAPVAMQPGGDSSLATGPEESRYLLEATSLLIVVYEWALGAPLNFMEFSWMTKPEIAYSWGRWFGHFHLLSRAFGREHPHIAQRIQRWDQIHQGILQNAPIDERDLAAMQDPQQYGVLHGDLNISNFYFLPGLPSGDTLSVFDWDQVQRGWYYYDLAQAAFAVHMLAENGSLVDASPVDEAQPDVFERHLFAGYTSVRGVAPIDTAQYRRMLQLRMYFYETFCRQAQKEGDVPVDMASFIDYIVRWFDKRHQAQPSHDA